jgi:hypothetical protein
LQPRTRQRTLARATPGVLREPFYPGTNRAASKLAAMIRVV